MRKGRVSFKVSRKVAKALDQMATEGRKVRVVGQVKKGLVEIDYKGLAELSRKFPKSTIAFVALNAPFKTRTLIDSL
jgi:hypothetical protein